MRAIGIDLDKIIQHSSKLFGGSWRPTSKEMEALLNILKEHMPEMVVIKGYTPTLEPILSAEYFIEWVQRKWRGVCVNVKCQDGSMRPGRIDKSTVPEGTYHFTDEGYRVRVA
jgi:hypothetical protein